MVHRRLAALAAALSLGLAAVPASASQHLMKIVEVFPGTVAQPNAQYIVMKSYNANQNFVAGYSVGIFDAFDALVTSFTFGVNVPNGADQAKILIATPEAETLFGVTADLHMTPDLPLAGGAVCFGAAPTYGFDCLSWGNHGDGFGGASNTGTAYHALTGLTLGQAVVCDETGGINPAGLDPLDCMDSAADHACGDAQPLANPLGSTPGFLAASPSCPVCGNNTVEISEECDGTSDGACPGSCQVDCTCGHTEQHVLGKVVVLKDPDPGVDATKRKLVLKAREDASPSPITGDPIAGGARLKITFSGTTPSTQTYTQTYLLPSGAAFWKALGTSGFRYKDSDLVNGPIKVLTIKKNGAGTLLITVLGKATNPASPLSFVPWNPGTQASLGFLPGGGDRYCVNFGGAAGGTVNPNTNMVFKVSAPTMEGACPPAP